MKRVAYFDILNIVSCISVIALHHNGIVHHFSDSSAWATALIVEVVCYFAVPVFYMLTGATLFGYEERYNTKIFIKKRLTRTLIPYLIFSMIAFAWGKYKGRFPDMTILKFAEYTVCSKFMRIYWFFIPLFWLYVLMPILTKIRNLKKETYLYLLGVLFVIVSVLPLVSNILPFEIPYMQNALLWPIMYAAIGYFLHTHKLDRRWRLLIYIAAFGCLILRYGVTYKLSMMDGVTNRTLFGYQYFTAAIPAMAVFLLIKQLIEDKKLKHANILATISSLSLGVYLLHVFVMEAEGYVIRHLAPTLSMGMLESWWWRTVMVLVTYSIATGATYIIRKTKIGKVITP